MIRRELNDETWSPTVLWWEETDLEKKIWIILHSFAIRNVSSKHRGILTRYFKTCNYNARTATTGSPRFNVNGLKRARCSFSSLWIYTTDKFFHENKYVCRCSVLRHITVPCDIIFIKIIISAIHWNFRSNIRDENNKRGKSIFPDKWVAIASYFFWYLYSYIYIYVIHYTTWITDRMYSLDADKICEIPVTSIYVSDT